MNLSKKGVHKVIVECVYNPLEFSHACEPEKPEKISTRPKRGAAAKNKRKEKKIEKQIFKYQDYITHLNSDCKNNRFIDKCPLCKKPSPNVLDA